MSIMLNFLFLLLVCDDAAELHTWPFLEQKHLYFFLKGINEPPIQLCLIFFCLDTSRVIFLITISTFSFSLLRIFPPLLALWLPQYWENWTPGSHCHSDYPLPNFMWKPPQCSSTFFLSVKLKPPIALQ